MGVIHRRSDEAHEVGEGDVVYIAGDELHCFEALGEAPLGFVCVIGPRPIPRSAS